MTPDHYEHPDYFQLDELLAEEHTLIRDSIRNWVKKQLSPVIEDYALEGKFPSFVVKELGELGAFGPTIPTEYGGGGLDYTAYGLIMQELERCDSGLRSTASVQGSLVMYPIYRYGTEEQRQHYLPRLARGEYLGCFGLTEADHGSDPGAMETNIKDQGDHYLLNGTKNWITNGGHADIYLVMAQSDPEKGAKGINAFIVEADQPGITIGKEEDKMGIRSSDTHSIMFDDVKVPKENLINKEGFGFKFAMKTLEGGRIGIAAQALGIASGAYELSLKYAQERKAFNKEIYKHQSIAFKLAEMATRVEAARNLTMKAAWLKDQHADYSTASSMAKLYASEAAMDIATEAVQVHGGYGYVREYHVERMMRDAKITQIYEGTSEVQRVVISRSILDQ